MRRFAQTALVTFLAVLVVIVGLAAVAGLVTSETPDAEADTPSIPEIENEQYDLDRFDIDGTPGEAAIQMDSATDGKRVVIEAGNVPPRDLQPLVNALIENNHTVSVRGGGTAGGMLAPGQPGARQPSPFDPDDEPLHSELTEADAFVSVGVSAYGSEEIEALGEFVDTGGRALMLTEPQQAFTGDTAALELQSELGVYTEPGYVYNLEENDLNYQRVFAESAGTSELTTGVDRAVFETSQTVESRDGNAALDVIDGTKRSTTRDTVDASVLVRNENVVLAGDTDFISPENALRADNDELIANLADFLVTGERDSEGDSTTGANGAVETVTVAPGDEPIFEPQVLEVEEGTTVRFEWAAAGYTIDVLAQPRDAEWAGVPEPQGAGFVHEHTFDVEGVYEFQSAEHAEEGMFGGIIVGEPGNRTA